MSSKVIAYSAHLKTYKLSIQVMYNMKSSKFSSSSSYTSFPHHIYFHQISEHPFSRLEKQSVFHLSTLILNMKNENFETIRVPSTNSTLHPDTHFSFFSTKAITYTFDDDSIITYTFSDEIITMYITLQNQFMDNTLIVSN